MPYAHIHDEEALTSRTHDSALDSPRISPRVRSNATFAHSPPDTARTRPPHQRHAPSQWGEHL